MELEYTYADYAADKAIELIGIDSPSGYTERAARWVQESFEMLGFMTERTQKGGVLVTVKGGSEDGLLLEAHVDTLGGMVAEVKSNGRLRITNIGGMQPNNAEAENVRVYTRSGRAIEGTCQLCNASVHVNGEYGDAKRSFDTEEIVLDEDVKSEEDTRSLGIEVGDIVCFEPRARITESGYVKSRFLDDKLSVGILLGICKYIRESGREPQRPVYAHITVYEEVGHGGSASLPAGVTEAISVDMGCVGDGLTCTERQVSICAKDSGGPYSYEVTGKLIEAAKAEKADYAVDVYPHYGSDESFPCLRPVVGRGKYLLSPESHDSGPWKIARTPVQFALENELLLDEQGKAFTPEQALKNGLPSTELPAWGNARLDEKKALAVLTEQLGKPFEGYEGLSPCRRALAVAFLAYANGDKKGCVSMLDMVSSSYNEIDGNADCPVLTDTAFEKRLKKAWARHKDVLSEKNMASHAAYELPWFMALLYRARQKGVLASSQFLWLRPMDRPLWYALNQCGGRTAWVESLAPWAHYKAEEQVGQALTEPHVDLAVTSLKDSLSAQGWLTDIFIPPMFEQSFTPAVEQAEPVSDMVYAAAENDPEYDANDDPSLAEEHY